MIVRDEEFYVVGFRNFRVVGVGFGDVSGEQATIRIANVE